MVNNLALRISADAFAARVDEQLRLHPEVSLAGTDREKLLDVNGIRTLLTVTTYVKDASLLEVTVADIAAPYVVPVPQGASDLKIKPTFYSDALAGFRTPQPTKAILKLKDGSGKLIQQEEVPFTISSTNQLSLAGEDVICIAALPAPYDPRIGRIAERIPLSRGRGAIFKWAEDVWNALQDAGFRYRSLPASAEAEGWQKVMSLEEQFSVHGGNSVDGAVLWASLAIRAGLDAQIVLLPGHAVVMVGYPNYKSPLEPFISERTALGLKSADALRAHASTLEYLSDAVAIETTAMGQQVNARGGPARRASLLDASLAGQRKLTEALQSKPEDVRVLQVKAWRDLGIEAQ